MVIETGFDAGHVYSILTTRRGRVERMQYLRAMYSILRAGGRAPVTHIDAGNPPHHWRGYRGALLAGFSTFMARRAVVPMARAHVVVIEDDAVLCRDFIARAEAALAERPGEFVHFYPRRAAAVLALQRGERWYSTRADWINSQAIALPVSRVEDFIRFGDRIPDSNREVGWGADTRLREFLIDRQLDMHFPLPALVQHGEPSTSFLGNQNRNRTTPIFADDVERRGGPR